MNFDEKRLVGNAFLMAQFNYYSLSSICHDRTYNKEINRLQERCLRLIYNDKSSSFEGLLEKDNSVSMHHTNPQALAIEMFKVETKTSLETMQEGFLFKEQGNQTDFEIHQVKSIHYGLESIRFLGPKKWESLPSNLKNEESVDSFKTATKRWNPPESCLRRLCKTFYRT